MDNTPYFPFMQAHRQRLYELGLWPNERCMHSVPVALVRRYAPEFGVALKSSTHHRKRTKRALCNALARSKPRVHAEQPPQTQTQMNEPIRWEYDAHFWSKYEIVRRLQAGHYGTVFEATRHATGERVAMKILHRVNEQTQHEVRLMRAALDDHEQCTPGVVCYVEHAKVPWPPDQSELRPMFAIVMEFIEGTDLFDVIVILDIR